MEHYRLTFEMATAASMNSTFTVLNERPLRDAVAMRRYQCLQACLGQENMDPPPVGQARAWQDFGEIEEEVVVIGTGKNKPAAPENVSENAENVSGTENTGAQSAPVVAPVPAAMPFSSLTVQWLMNNYQTDKNGSIPRSTVYYHYIEHCKLHNLEPLNAASFGKLIRSVFLRIETRRLGTRGKSRYHYSGLVLKPTSTLRYIDVNELPSYYGHPSRTTMTNPPTFTVDFNITRNVPRNTYSHSYKERASNYVRTIPRPPTNTGKLREFYAKKRLQALKEYFTKIAPEKEKENENQSEAEQVGVKSVDDGEEMEEQFVVLNFLFRNELTVETTSLQNPDNFQQQQRPGLVPLLRVSPKRSGQHPMQFSSVTVQWLMNNFKTDKSGSIPRSAVYFHYMEHCNFHGLEPLNAASFGKLIRSVFLGIETRRLGTRGRSRYHYSGLVLKPTSTLKFVDLNDLPSYYGHPSGIAAKESQNYHLNYTRNMSLCGSVSGRGRGDGFTMAVAAAGEIEAKGNGNGGRVSKIEVN